MTRTNDAVVITGPEWEAVLHGARALREVAADLRRGGSPALAAENESHAVTLEGLGRRAEVSAAEREEQAYAMYEALTDPFDAAVREHEASTTGVLDPSDQELHAEFVEVCRELGMLPSDQVAEQEAER